MALPEATPSGKSTKTRLAILEATSSLIAERGFDGFTISEVAKLAKVNRALIYHYFHDKDNLLMRAVSHIMSRFDQVRPDGGTSGVAANVRMHIEHPEIARFLFQVVLSDHSLPSLWPRLTTAIEGLERFKREHSSNFDPAFVTIMLALAQLSWAIWRREFSHHLGLSVEEADERFVATLIWAAALGLEDMARPRG